MATAASPTPALPAKVPPSPRGLKFQELKDFFSLPSRRTILQGAIAEGSPLNAERIITAAIAAVIKDDKLIECDNQSIFDCVLAATQLQLLIGKEIGHAYLVPFRESAKEAGGKDKMICTLILGFRGLIALARRSGEIVSITAEVVFKRDKFNAREGTDGHLIHEPDYFADDRGPAIGAYAYAKLAGGGEQWAIMGKRAIEAIRTKSKAVNSGPWKREKDAPDVPTFEELEMWKKTAVRRLYKLLPITVETSEVADADDEREFGERGARDVTPFASGRTALPSSEASTLQRADNMQPTQAERVKADLKREQAEQAQPAGEEPAHDGQGVVDEEPVIPPGFEREEEKKPAGKKAEKKAEPAAAKSEPAADAKPPEERKPTPAGAGLAIASGIIDNAEAATETSRLIELDQELRAAVDAGKVGSTHAARAASAIEKARARVQAADQ